MQRHIMSAARGGEAGVHGWRGLFLDDEQVLAGRAYAEAVRDGYITPTDDDEEEETDSSTGDTEKPSEKPSKKPRSSSTNAGIRASVAPITLTLSPSLQGYFAISRSRFTDGWEPTPEGMAAWLLDVVEKFFSDHRGYLFGIEDEELTPEQETQIGEILSVVQSMDDSRSPRDEFQEDAIEMAGIDGNELSKIRELLTQIIPTLENLANRVTRLEGA